MASDPDSNGELVFPQAASGYRVWEMINGKLHPLFARGGDPWVPGVNTAVCLPGSVFPYPGVRTTDPRHQAPAPNCKCGFNAHHQLQGALDETRIWVYQQSKYNWRYRNRTLVLGAIAGRGHLELHNGGFRCQQAQILGLTQIKLGLLFGSPKVGKITEELRRTAEYYQVQAFASTEQLSDYCKQLPQVATVPAELLPELPPLPHFLPGIPKQADGYWYTMIVSAIVLAFSEAALEVSPSVQLARSLILVSVMVLVSCMLASPARISLGRRNKHPIRTKAFNYAQTWQRRVDKFRGLFKKQ